MATPTPPAGVVPGPVDGPNDPGADLRPAPPVVPLVAIAVTVVGLLGLRRVAIRHPAVVAGDGAER